MSIYKDFKYWLLCIICLLSTNHLVQGQSTFSKDNFKFEVFALPGGALANQVQQMVQDKNGFLWFASKGGLIKYDGRTFKTFQHQPNNPNSLPINFVESLLFDSKGMLWIGTYGKGVIHFDTELEQFSKPINLEKEVPNFKDLYVYALEEDDDHNLWIGTNSGLIQYNLETEATKFYDENTKEETALNCKIIWSLYKDKAGTIWAGTGLPWLSNANWGGLHRYNKNKDNFTRFLNNPVDNSSLSDNRVRAIFEDSKNNFWVGTMGDGLHLMNRSKGTFKRFGDQTNPKNSLSRPYILDATYSDKDFSQVTFIHEDQLGRLWTGAFNGGLNIYDPQSNQQIHFEINTGLPSNYIFNILETNDNTIFISTGDVGGNVIFKVSYSSNLFEQGILPKKDSTEKWVQNIIEDSQGNIWLSAIQEGRVFKWETSKNTINADPSILNTASINTLGLDSKDNLWIGYDQKGIQIVSPNGDQLKNRLPSDLIKQLSAENIHAIFEDSRNNIWISSGQNGVTIVHTNQSLVHLHKDNKVNSLTGETINSIIEDKEGNIWLFGNIRDPDGIYSLTIDKYLTATNTTQSYLERGEENGFISSVDIDKNQCFWFTNGLDGIKKFNPKTGIITTINTTNSRIPSDEILALLVAKNDIVWMHTKNKIIAYHPEKNAFRFFDALDGVAIELWYGSIFEQKNDQIIFGGRNGCLVINPNSLDWEQQFKTPKILISDFKIDNQAVLVTSKLLDNNPIWEKKHLVLDHDQSNFSFGLSSLDYHESSNYLEYFLENYDSYWRRVGKEQVAHYVKVPPGDYTFKTRGANHLGGWNELGTSIAITVQAPWSETWWAYLIYLLVGAAILYSLYRLQIKRLTERQEAVQIKELDALKTKLYANITHEFRTPLTLILGQAQQIQKENDVPQKTKTKVKSIEKNGHRLLHLVNQLLDIRKVEAKEEKVNTIQGDIIPILSTIADQFQSLAINKGIDYQVHLPHPPLKMDYDADKLQKIISNLISNAIKFTSKEGRVTFFAQELDNNLIVNVKDSGIGIENEALPHIFNRFYRADNSHQIGGTGIGLALTKELVDLLQGHIQVTSKKEIGSEFIVKLPITNTAPITSTPVLSNSILEMEDSTNIYPSDDTRKTLDLPIVLIVEDNIDVAQFTASCLKDKYVIHFAENGQIGIDIALEIIPDLIISDVMMPQKDGFELCKTLKKDEKTAHIPIILLTARVDIEDKIAGLSRGADAYLAKPFNQTELTIRIEQLLQLREKLKERYAGLNLKKPSTDKALQLNDEFILKVRTTIEAHLEEEKFGVEELSKAIFLSRAQVHRKIKALTGKSTGQFMHTVRLHHALQLLQETNKSITVIAFNVGYNDPSYFTRMFTREFGHPPSYFVKKGN